MEIHQLHLVLGSVPLLLYFGQTAAHAGERGAILCYHGLGANKDAQSKELWSLAQAGFLAIGVDVVGHGERRYPDFEERFTRDNPQSEANFVQTLCDAIQEIPVLVDQLIQLGLCHPEKIGMVGISMGGYITYAAPLADPRIRVIAPVLASPQWKIPHPDSPYHYPDRYFPTAMLVQNAGDDPFVPTHLSREFCKKLRHYYKQDTKRLSYIEFPGVGHFMPEREWHELWDNVIKWFQRFLGRF